jgi:soluble lytic murein transglycosylase-like protein
MASVVAFALSALSLSATSLDTRYGREVDAALADVSRVYPVPRSLVLAVIEVESAGNPRAVSRAGALGLMQLMPANASRLGVSPESLFDPAKNILAGTRLLAVLLRYYAGDLVSVLVAYNAGPHPRGAAIPQNGETPQYVRAVLTHCHSRLATQPRR